MSGRILRWISANVRQSCQWPGITSLLHWRNITIHINPVLYLHQMQVLTGNSWCQGKLTFNVIIWSVIKPLILTVWKKYGVFMWSSLLDILLGVLELVTIAMTVLPVADEDCNCWNIPVWWEKAVFEKFCASFAYCVCVATDGLLAYMCRRWKHCSRVKSVPNWQAVSLLTMDTGTSPSALMRMLGRPTCTCGQMKSSFKANLSWWVFFLMPPSKKKKKKTCPIPLLCCFSLCLYILHNLFLESSFRLPTWCNCPSFFCSLYYLMPSYVGMLSGFLGKMSTSLCPNIAHGGLQVGVLPQLQHKIRTCRTSFSTKQKGRPLPIQYAHLRYS